MKIIRSFMLGILCPWVIASCSTPNLRVSEGQSYSISGSLWQDSLTVDSIVTLIIDRHESCCTPDGDTLAAWEQFDVPVVQGNFLFQGAAPLDADEIYIYDQQGFTCLCYGLSGQNISIERDREGNYTQSGADTTDLFRALLLRDSILAIKDSIKVRRLLGSLPETAKPEWLMQSVDYMLKTQSEMLGKSTRLPRVSVQMNDTVISLLENRQESLLLYFWSEEIPTSADSLTIFKAIERDFGLHTDAKSFEKEKSKTRRSKARRIGLLSFCLQSGDSATWQSTIKDIPGHHAILQGGLAHPLAQSCHIQSLPALLIVDRYGNYQMHDVWGNDLYKWLEKAPMNSDINKNLSSEKKVDKPKLKKVKQ